MKWNKEIKQAWLEALKSGKYPHGTGSLKTDEGKYCCLGVLTDICEDLEMSESGFAPEDINKDVYEQLGKATGISNIVERLYGINDKSSSFDAVIPIIEAIPVSSV